MIKNKSSNVFLWIILSAAACFIAFFILQISFLSFDYAIDIPFDETFPFFASVNGIFAAVMVAFALCMLFKKKNRVVAFKAFLWASLFALLYYALPMFSTVSALIVSYYDVPAVILSLMLYVPHMVLCALIVSLLFDFGKGIKISCVLSLISFFASAFFMIFHISCILSQMVAFNSSYDIFAQFTNISVNILFFAVSAFVFCVTRNKEMFCAFVHPDESDIVTIESSASGAD